MTLKHVFVCVLMVGLMSHAPLIGASHPRTDSKDDAGTVRQWNEIATDAIVVTGANSPAASGVLMANVPIKKDGVYHVAALEGGEDVRLSEDYFIEAQKDKPPEIKITKPGRDSHSRRPSPRLPVAKTRSSRGLSPAHPHRRLSLP